VAGLDIKEFETQGETLPMGEKVLAERVDVGDLTVWKATFEPGWRYTEHADPAPCPAPHAAYIVSGRLRIGMEDGSEAEAGPGSVVVIEPGHDAWTIGDEPCVFIDFGEALIQYSARE
jgi:quercetin dioxygenase-like cupin family protein